MKAERRRRWRFIYGALICASALLAVNRWTFRDTRGVTALAFYMGQPIVISGLLGFAALSAWRLRRRRVVIVTLFSAGVFAAVWATQSFRFGGGASPSTAHRLVVWNVMSGRLGWEAVYETLGELDADVIVLVEAWEDSQERDELRDRYLEGYASTPEHAGLVIISRNALSDIEFDRLAGGGRYLHAKVKVGRDALRVLAVDVESDPRRHRQYPLENVAAVAKRFGDGPLVIAGDFNTPPDSVHYAAMRSSLRNAFEIAGDGYAPTWPSFAPTIALDQIWVNDRVEAHRCWSGWTLRSDHRPVVLEFGL